MDERSSEGRRMPGEIMGTLGKTASYSPTLPMDERPVLHGYRSTAGRSPENGGAPLPRPNLNSVDREEQRGKAGFWTKQKLIIALIVLILVILLVIVLPIALTLSHNAIQHSNATANATIASKFKGTEPAVVDDDPADFDGELVGPSELDPPYIFTDYQLLNNFTEISPLKPPPVANCSTQGHQCPDDGSFIGEHLLCDGAFDCPDGSDEANCTSCQTGLSCAGESGGVLCLRGSRLCDGVADCADAADERKYCGLESCPQGAFRCQPNHPGEKLVRCIPNEWRCDGDPHCPGEEDEAGCEAVVAREGACSLGAFWCSADLRCLSSWQRCDGTRDCSSGEDEVGCGCAECQGGDRVLCSPPTSEEKASGVCISHAQLCDGKEDCPQAQDEINCPGWCAADTTPATRECGDGRRYPLRYACSGLVPACNASCLSCDPEIAHTCTAKKADPSAPGPLCVHRSKLCDGSADCGDGSDEAEAECSCSWETAPSPQLAPFVCPPSALAANAGHTKCIQALRRCDGFPDCPDGADEAGCERCGNRARGLESFHCAVSQRCFPSTARCDGLVHCPDYSDEDFCSCTQCKSQSYATYMCERGSRCLRASFICNPNSPHHCPGEAPEDLAHCRKDFDPLNPEAASSNSFY